MPAKNFLTPGQQENLQKEIKSSSDSHFRERALMLLLMNDGKTYQEIANFIGCAYRSVAYWCVHGDADDLDSLKDQRTKGNYTKATPEYIQLLMEVVETEPSDLGYEFGRWTGERLATYLAQKTGIQLTGTQVRRILKKKVCLPVGAESPGRILCPANPRSKIQPRGQTRLEQEGSI